MEADVPLILSLFLPSLLVATQICQRMKGANGWDQPSNFGAIRNYLDVFGARQVVDITLNGG